MSYGSTLCKLSAIGDGPEFYKQMSGWGCADVSQLREEKDTL